MDYKLIISDFDGTLLRSDSRTVSDASKKAIGDYRAAGGFFTIATGRMLASVLNQLKKVGLLGLDIPLISYQGALITNIKSGKILHSAAVPNDLAVAFTDFTERNGLYTQIYVMDGAEDKMLIKERTEFTDGYCRMTEGAYHEIHGSLSEYLKRTGAESFKLLCVMNPADNLKYREIFAKEFPQLSIISSSPYFVEAINPLAGKGSACAKVAEMYGIKQSETVCVGDANNDLTMVKYAGLGVAVANADPELKAAAQVIAPSNDDDGVAWVIGKFGLGEKV